MDILRFLLNLVIVFFAVGIANWLGTLIISLLQTFSLACGYGANWVIDPKTPLLERTPPLFEILVSIKSLMSITFDLYVLFFGVHLLFTISWLDSIMRFLAGSLAFLIVVDMVGIFLVASRYGKILREA